MVFHEITKPAIAAALDETRDIDERLVDAQETRRILDRLYGYEISPVLWKKITKGLSAGRVQSVATRLVVERERERMAFRAAQWWDLVATFDPESVPRRASSRSTASASRPAATSAPDGALRGDATQLDEDGRARARDPGSRAPPSASRASTRSRTRASRRRRS